MLDKLKCWPHSNTQWQWFQIILRTQDGILRALKSVTFILNLIVVLEEKSDNHSCSVDYGSFTETFGNLSRHCWDISVWIKVVNRQIQHAIFTWWPFSFNITHRMRSSNAKIASHCCVLSRVNNLTVISEDIGSCKSRETSLWFMGKHVCQLICDLWTTADVDFQWVPS